MMKKRIFAFLSALLMLVCCTLPTFALTRLPLEITVNNNYLQQYEPTTGEKIRDALLNALRAVMEFIRAHSIILIIVLILVAVVVPITISEMKMQKEREEKQPPKKKKKNEK